MALDLCYVGRILVSFDIKIRGVIKKYLTQKTPSLRPHFYYLVWYYIYIFFQFVSQIHEKIWWNKILTKIYEILNQIMQLLHFILFFIYHSFQCMYIRLEWFCNLNFSDSEDIHVIIGWSRRSLNSSGVGFWRQIVFLN